MGVTGAKAVQHAGQRKKQHKAVQARNGGQWQHAPARGQIATQHQGEEGKGNVKNLQHARIVAGFWRCRSTGYLGTGDTGDVNLPGFRRVGNR